MAFNLAISCLITSYLPLLMDLTFQVPLQHCSLQCQTLLSQPDTSTSKHHFHFGPTTSFFVELLVIVLCSSPIAYWTPSNLRALFSDVISFCLFILSLGFSIQLYWTVFPFPLPVDQVLSELFTMTSPYVLGLHGMAHSFIESCKPLYYNKPVIHA